VGGVFLRGGCTKGIEVKKERLRVGRCCCDSLIQRRESYEQHSKSKEKNELCQKFGAENESRLQHMAAM
jgi:hypothetical protein